jgi:hypothetical protein
MGYSAQKLIPVCLGALEGWLPPPRISACRWDRKKFQRLPHVLGVQQLHESGLNAVWPNRKSEIQPSSRHLGFPTSSLVAQHRDYFHWVVGPQKQGRSRWSFVPVSSTIWGPTGSGNHPFTSNIHHWKSLVRRGLSGQLNFFDQPKHTIKILQVRSLGHSQMKTDEVQPDVFFVNTDLRRRKAEGQDCCLKKNHTTESENLYSWGNMIENNPLVTFIKMNEKDSKGIVP